MLCSACYDNLVTYLNKFLHQKADVCLNKTQISTLLAVLQIHDTGNTRTGSEVLLDKFLSPEPSLWKFFTDFDGLCFFLFSFLQYGSVSGSNRWQQHGWQLSSLLRRAIPERRVVNKEIWKRHGYLHTKMLEVLWAAFWVSSKFFFPLQEIILTWWPIPTSSVTCNWDLVLPLSPNRNHASSPSISSGFPDNLLVSTIHQR